MIGLMLEYSFVLAAFGFILWVMSWAASKNTDFLTENTYGRYTKFYGKIFPHQTWKSLWAYFRLRTATEDNLRWMASLAVTHSQSDRPQEPKRRYDEDRDDEDKRTYIAMERLASYTKAELVRRQDILDKATEMKRRKQQVKEASALLRGRRPRQ